MGNDFLDIPVSTQGGHAPLLGVERAQIIGERGELALLDLRQVGHAATIATLPWAEPFDQHGRPLARPVPVPLPG
jgi:hypothetical protein